MTSPVGTAWNGCNPNTVMSSHWRASLVPAVAVIPAPSVYAVIAAVKTLVVRPRDSGPFSVVGPTGRSDRWRCQNPSGVCSLGSPTAEWLTFCRGRFLIPQYQVSSWSSDPDRSLDGMMCSCCKYPPLDPEAVSLPTLAIGTACGSRPCVGKTRPAACQPSESAIVVTLVKAVCFKHPTEAPSGALSHG